MSADILIVDDEKDIREIVSGLLEDEGYITRTAAHAAGALKAVRERRPALVILDVWLQGSDLDGLGVLEEVKRIDPGIPVILISGHGTIETAVAAIRKGAYDFIEKPFKSDRLLLLVDRALEVARLKRENTSLRERSSTKLTLIGDSPGIHHVRQIIQKVAMANSRVLVEGGLGAGKETVARKIHESSHRSDGEFVPISASALSPDTVEEELFGIEDGQGRIVKPGLFERAHMGTLYIDEVSDMPRETQGKLLRMLVASQFFRVGGSDPVSVDIRVISSTSRNLPAAISRGDFREDLYHRLNVVPVKVPSLNERREDIPALVDYFTNLITKTSGLAPRRFSPEVVAWMQAKDWPGNVRQLRNFVERILILAPERESGEITMENLPNENDTSSLNDEVGIERLVSMTLRDARVQFERRYLTVQISRFGGNISRTANFIGMERSALHRKLKTLGVNEPGKPAGNGDDS